jgi:hypothetical protein
MEGRGRQGDAGRLGEALKQFSELDRPARETWFVSRSGPRRWQRVVRGLRGAPAWVETTSP